MLFLVDTLHLKCLKKLLNKIFELKWITYYFKFQNEAFFDEVFQQANFNTFVFRSRVKLETFNVSKSAMVIILRKCQLVCFHAIVQVTLLEEIENMTVWHMNCLLILTDRTI